MPAMRLFKTPRGFSLYSRPVGGNGAGRRAVALSYDGPAQEVLELLYFPDYVPLGATADELSLLPETVCPATPEEWLRAATTVHTGCSTTGTIDHAFTATALLHADGSATTPATGHLREVWHVRPAELGEIKGEIAAAVAALATKDVERQQVDPQWLVQLKSAGSQVGLFYTAGAAEWWIVENHGSAWEKASDFGTSATTELIMRLDRKDPDAANAFAALSNYHNNSLSDPKVFSLKRFASWTL